jgi:hypothetical protein
MNKPMWLAGLAAAIGVPYMVIDGQVPQWLQGSRQQLFGGYATTPHQAGEIPSAYSNANYATVQTPVVPLEEALQVQIHPQWIVARWPHVTTVVSETNLSGYRVPIITGHQPHDVVGSLTYYFDHTHKLRRISLIGNTRDENKIVALTMQQFALRPEPTLQGGLFLARNGQTPLSALLIQYAPMLSADASQPDRTIHLEWNAPMNGMALSAEMMQKIAGR